MTQRRSGANWTWEETLIAFRLYCRTAFGKLHQHNPEIISLAAKLGRTPSSVGMKACNFASLDPVQQARGIKGLANRSRLEEEIWRRFSDDSEAIAAEAEQAYEGLSSNQAGVEVTELQRPAGPTDELRTVRVRRVQSFFRDAVLTSYGYRCALTGLAIPALLNASHIVPWSVSTARRADPRNGICLNVLHDRAFDRGLITFDPSLRMVLSPGIDLRIGHGTLVEALAGCVGRPLVRPERFAPDEAAMAYHRDHIFQKETN